MKASAWIAPYGKKPRKASRRRALSPASASGVYLIRDADTKKIVYVGKSHTQIKKTIYRHFEKWTPPDRHNPGNFGYKSYRNPARFEVRIILCTKAQADRLEIILIRYHNPRDNSEKIAGLFDALPKEEKQQAYNDYKTAEQAFNSPEIDALEDAPF